MQLVGCHSAFTGSPRGEVVYIATGLGVGGATLDGLSHLRLRPADDLSQVLCIHVQSRLLLVHLLLHQGEVLTVVMAGRGQGGSAGGADELL